MIDLAPFWEATPAVRIHAAAGVLAFVLGTTVMVRRKGGRWHKRIGKAWIATMVTLAVSGLFIHQVRMWGIWSPFHLFVPVTLASCWWAVWTIRQRDLKAHASTMIGLYCGGVLVAGGMTFAPGLLMHRIFIGASETLPAIFPSIVVVFGLAIGSALAAPLVVRRWHGTAREQTAR